MKKIALGLAAALALASTGAFAAEPSPIEQLPTKQAGFDRPAPPGEEHFRGAPGEHPGKHAGSEHKGRPGGMFKELSLTKEQRETLRSTMRDEAIQQKAIVGSYLGKLPQSERDALAAELRANHDKQVAKFLAVLNPDQKQKASEAFLKFNERSGHERRVPPPPPGHENPGVVNAIPPAPPAK